MVVCLSCLESCWLNELCVMTCGNVYSLHAAHADVNAIDLKIIHPWHVTMSALHAASRAMMLGTEHTLPEHAMARACGALARPHCLDACRWVVCETLCSSSAPTTTQALAGPLSGRMAATSGVPRPSLGAATCCGDCPCKSICLHCQATSGHLCKSVAISTPQALAQYRHSCAGRCKLTLSNTLLCRNAMGNAIYTYRQFRESFRGVQLRGMQQDLSWDKAAEQYEQVLIDAKYQW